MVIIILVKIKATFITNHSTKTLDFIFCHWSVVTIVIVEQFLLSNLKNVFCFLVCFSERDNRQRHVSSPRGSWGFSGCTQSVLAHIRRSPENLSKELPPKPMSALFRPSPETTSADPEAVKTLTDGYCFMKNEHIHTWDGDESGNNKESRALYARTAYIHMQVWLGGSTTDLCRAHKLLLEKKTIIQGSLTAWCIICSLQINPSYRLAMHFPHAWTEYALQNKTSTPSYQRKRRLFKYTFSQCCPLVERPSGAPLSL